MLPQAVEQLIEQICREQNQTPPETEVRHELALVGEEEAVNLLRKIAASTIKKTLSAFIMYMIRNAKQPPSPQKVPRVSPLPSPSSPSPSAPQSQSRLVYPPTQQGMGMGMVSTSHSFDFDFDCYLFQINKWDSPSHCSKPYNAI